MKTARIALSAATILFLMVGYFASQYAAFTGRAAEYAASVDRPEVRYLALALLLLALLFAFLPERPGVND